MKRTFSLIVFTLITYCVQAQSIRIFFNQHADAVNDSSLAFYKVILTKWPGDTSLWAASTYTMKNQLVVEGVYKDRAMTVPNGDFKYYYNQDSVHYLTESGGYFNGAKFGAWIKYFPDGKKKTLETYRDNVLNGPYETYSEYSPDPVTMGQYVNGKKDGKWIFPSITDTYKDDVEIAFEHNTSFDREIARRRRVEEKRKKELHFIDAREAYDFVEYMRPQLKAYFGKWPPGNSIKEITISFTVNEDGKLSNGELLMPAEKNDVDIIAKAINTAKPWKPATSYGRPVAEWVFYTFQDDNGQISRGSIGFP